MEDTRMTKPIIINNHLIDDIKKFGAFDVSACFNCGTCTATCPLVKPDSQEEFPRGMIRLAQLGQKEKLLGSKELWMCYHCGDCSASCPRQADPSKFMQAARSYVVSEYEPTKLSSIINSSKMSSLLIMSLIGILMAVLMNYANVNLLFEHDYIVLGGNFGEIIHYTGLIAGILMLLIFIIGAIKMATMILNNEPLRKREYIMDRITWKHSIRLLFHSLIDIAWNEVLLQKNFMRGNEVEEVFYKEGTPPSYLKVNVSFEPSQKISRRVIHLNISLGFIGLAVATAFDYLVKDLLLHDPAGWVPIYHPVRLLGIISGIAMMFGTSTSLYYRVKKPSDNEYYQKSKFDDYLILILIDVVGLTGFLATIMVYQNPLPSWAMIVLIAHVVAVAELFFVLPITKFAHVIYRPLALWLREYQEQKIKFLENLPEEKKVGIIKVPVK